MYSLRLLPKPKILFNILFLFLFFFHTLLKNLLFLFYVLPPFFVERKVDNVCAIYL